MTHINKTLITFSVRKTELLYTPSAIEHKTETAFAKYFHKAMPERNKIMYIALYGLFFAVHIYHIIDTTSL